MKKYFLLINVIVGFACSPEKKQVATIPSEKMVALLTDIHILEARVDKLHLDNDSSYKVYNSLEREVFEVHGVTKDEYEQAYAYYLAHPLVLDDIYNIVVDSLNVIQKRGYHQDSELQGALPKGPDEDQLPADSSRKVILNKMKKLKLEELK